MPPTNNAPTAPGVTIDRRAVMEIVQSVQNGMDVARANAAIYRCEMALTGTEPANQWAALAGLVASMIVNVEQAEHPNYIAAFDTLVAAALATHLAQTGGTLAASPVAGHG